MVSLAASCFRILPRWRFNEIIMIVTDLGELKQIFGAWLGKWWYRPPLTLFGVPPSLWKREKIWFSWIDGQNHHAASSISLGMDQQTPPHMPHGHIFHTFILSYNYQEWPKLPESQTPPHLPHGHIFQHKCALGCFKKTLFQKNKKRNPPCISLWVSLKRSNGIFDFDQV